MSSQPPQKSVEYVQEMRNYGAVPDPTPGQYFAHESLPRGDWRVPLFGDCGELLLSCIVPCFLIGARSQHLGYHWITNMFFTTPLFFRDRAARHLDIARDQTGFFHTNLGACTLFALLWLNTDRRTTAGTLAVHAITSTLLAQATAEVRAAPYAMLVPDVMPARMGYVQAGRGRVEPALTALYPLGGYFGNEEWKSRYCDFCAAGPLCSVMSIFFPQIALAWEKSSYDSSSLFFNLFFVSPCALREELRAQHGIAVDVQCGKDGISSCTSLTPLINDFFGAILPCGTVQSIRQMRSTGGRGRYFMDDGRV